MPCAIDVDPMGEGVHAPKLVDKIQFFFQTSTLIKVFLAIHLIQSFFAELIQVKTLSERQFGGIQ